MKIKDNVDLNELERFGFLHQFPYATDYSDDYEFEYVKPIRLKGKIYNVGSDEKWKNY